MSVEKLFHVSSTLLGADSTLLPGNWGRILGQYRYGQVTPTYARECIFEQIREECFPEKPSRFRSLFLLPTLLDARFYQSKHHHMGVIYEVEVETEAKRHYGNYEFWGLIDSTTPLKQLERAAERYWSQAPTEHIEILVEGSGKIVATHEAQ